MNRSLLEFIKRHLSEGEERIDCIWYRLKWNKYFWYQITVKFFTEGKRRGQRAKRPEPPSSSILSLLPSTFPADQLLGNPWSYNCDTWIGMQSYILLPESKIPKTAWDLLLSRSAGDWTVGVLPTQTIWLCFMTNSELLWAFLEDGFVMQLLASFLFSCQEDFSVTFSSPLRIVEYLLVFT